MTEYDFSPGAWEAHLAKQASIARWSQETAQQKHAYSNPFKPSPEEIARKDASDFYGSGEMYDGPDRPPTPTNPGPTRGAGFYGYPSQAQVAPGQQQQNPPNAAGPHQSAYYYYAGSVLVPRWTGTTWVYEPRPGTGQPQGSAAATAGMKSSSSSIKSGKSTSSKKQRPTPAKSYTLPPSYVYQQQNPQYFQMPLPPQPNSGNTTASGGSNGGQGAYAAYPYPTVMVDGAMRKDSKKLKKKKDSVDGSSFFGRLGK